MPRITKSFSASVLPCAIFRWSDSQLRSMPMPRLCPRGCITSRWSFSSGVCWQTILFRLVCETMPASYLMKSAFPGITSAPWNPMPGWAMEVWAVWPPVSSIHSHRLSCQLAGMASAMNTGCSGRNSITAGRWNGLMTGSNSARLGKSSVRKIPCRCCCTAVLIRCPEPMGH